MSRNGKIATLPRAVREQINVRLDDGEEADPLLDWLNQLPEVQKLMKENFAGVPISKQNLSEWRQGGFREFRSRKREGTRGQSNSVKVSQTKTRQKGGGLQ